MNPITKLKTRYAYKSHNKNYIFYICNKKNCKGKGRIDLNTNNFYVTVYCNKETNYIEIEYSEFI